MFIGTSISSPIIIDQRAIFWKGLLGFPTNEEGSSSNTGGNPYSVIINWDTTVSWYAPKAEYPNRQLNDSQYTYVYVAVG